MEDEIRIGTVGWVALLVLAGQKFRVRPTLTGRAVVVILTGSSIR